MPTDIDKMARRLFEVYKASLPKANVRVGWYELPDAMVEAWRRVAEEAVALLTSRPA